MLILYPVKLGAYVRVGELLGVAERHGGSVLVVGELVKICVFLVLS